MNLYAYVGGDPVNFVDPWGLQYQHVGFAHDNSGNPYISYHGKRVATNDGSGWVANDGTQIPGNRSSIMSEYEDKGNFEDMCDIGSDFAKDLAELIVGASISEAGYVVNPGLGVFLDALGHVVAPSNANAPTFQHDIPVK